MRTWLTFLFLSFVVVPAFAAPLHIRLIDKSTPYVNGTDHWTTEDYPFADQALSNQMQAVDQYYLVLRGIVIDGFGVPSTATWRVFVRNQCLFGGVSYSAFHWKDSVGPYACIASVNGGGYWWMTRAMEHEATEMVGDPSATGREIVDPVAQYFGEVVDGQFSFDYSDFAGWPFVDFLLLNSAHDYLGMI